jgi:hypothetical protein
MRDAPSSIEYSVWTWRWTNDRANCAFLWMSADVVHRPVDDPVEE